MANVKYQVWIEITQNISSYTRTTELANLTGASSETFRKYPSGSIQRAAMEILSSDPTVSTQRTYVVSLGYHSCRETAIQSIGKYLPTLYQIATMVGHSSFASTWHIAVENHGKLLETAYVDEVEEFGRILNTSVSAGILCKSEPSYLVSTGKMLHIYSGAHNARTLFAASAFLYLIRFPDLVKKTIGYKRNENSYGAYLLWDFLADELITDYRYEDQFNAGIRIASVLMQLGGSYSTNDSPMKSMDIMYVNGPSNAGIAFSPQVLYKFMNKLVSLRKTAQNLKCRIGNQLGKESEMQFECLCKIEDKREAKALKKDGDTSLLKEMAQEMKKVSTDNDW